MVGNFLSSSGRTRQYCEELAERLAMGGWPVVTASQELNRVRRLYDMLSTALHKRSRYEVAYVEVFSGASFLWALLVSKTLAALGKRFVINLHGGGLVEYADKHPGRVRRLLHAATSVVTPSRFLREGLCGIRSDIHYIPNAIEIQVYPFRLRNRPKPRLCWLRAFHAIYNPVMAIETVAQLVREFPETALTMYGPDKGDGTWQLAQRRRDELGIVDHVEMPGRIPKTEVPDHLNRADIFLNTTRFEGFGISVMEAAACGLCLVTTAVGELPRIWSDGIDALLVPPDDPASMAGAVRRILTEPGLAEQLSQRARNNAEQYDWSVVLPQWEALLTSLTSPR
jgi:glycosyltransferase involved in cell wall biosynthesis